MEPLLGKLRKVRVLVADGAMGTMLLKKGMKAGECPEKINSDKPQILEEIAELYLKSGADIIQTNTFGASPLKLSQYSLEEHVKAINVNAVRAVRKVVGNNAYISGSCGPSGKILKPYGDTEPEDILDSFKQQISALVSEGIDIICIETMTDINEALLAVEYSKTISPSTPVSAAMTFNATRRGFFTIMGNSIEQTVKGLLAAGADIIGSNCGNGIENMISIANEFKKHTSIPLIIQSNAGLPELKNGEIYYSETPEITAEGCRELLESGVNIIGGCCGTTPAHIAAIRKVADEFINS